MRECALVYIGVSIATVALARLGRLPVWAPYSGVALSAVFLLTALHLAGRQPGGIRRFGIDMAGLMAAAEDEAPGLRGFAVTLRRALPVAGRETLVSLAVAACVFVPYTGLFAWWFQPTQAFRWQLAPDFMSFALTQWLVVALPEEALFRGYFYSRLAQAWPERSQLLGATLSWPAFIVQALLFGVLHVLVDLDGQRLAVCLPALLFGWLRAWRGGIGAATLLHAGSNLLSDFLHRGWLAS